MLRDGALSSQRVIELVNKEFVPVWVNVRAEPYPQVGATAHEDWVLWLSDGNRVLNPGYLGYLSRTYVLSPDARRLLNDNDGMLGRSTWLTGDYFDMLQRCAWSYDVARKERTHWVGRATAARGAGKAGG